MSKIGRKPIDIGSVQVEIQGNTVIYKGKRESGQYELPTELKVSLENGKLKILSNSDLGDINRIWGLHRALIANRIKGAESLFEKQLKIVGLGFKAALAGNKLKFALGFSHDIEYVLPDGVTVETDKTGQLLTFKSSDKENLGRVCSAVRSLRKPEPYKGTGIQYVGEVIHRKAGKTKSA